MRILIVDDDQNGLLLLEAMLKGFGHEVVAAENGEIALELARVTPPELIVSDILMPVMDGYALCREWKRDNKLRSIPFIFYTATYTDPRDEELALSLGAERFIVKPVAPDEFRRILQEIIRGVEKGKIAARKPALEEEKEVFKLYSERLVNKLEKKMLDLERQIADGKQADEALYVSALSWKTTFDAIADSVCIIDTEGKILQCNKATANFLGKPLNEIVGKTCWELIHNTSGPIKRCPVVRMRESLRPESLELAVDDRVLYVVTHPILDQDSNLSRAVHTITDISERKQAEEELLKAKKFESLGVLAGGIAHDFNNMLTAVLGNISLSRMTAETYDMEETVRLLAEAQRAAMGAKDLTARLITFSEGGEPFKEEVSIGGLVRESVNAALKGSYIQCGFSIPDDLWSVEIDVTQMKQVIHNIVTNSMEAMSTRAGGAAGRPGRGTIKVYCRNIELGEKDGLALKHGKYVKISIKDQGAGIAQENLSKVFDPYFSTKEMGAQKGMGLGLTVAYSIVKKHGGLITIESEVGGGTTVHIHIPAVTAERPGEIVSELHGPVEAPGEEREHVDVQSSIVNGQYPIKRVLVMDDEEMLRNVFAAMLSRAGYQVGLAADGVEAIEVYKKARESGEPFDLVILDLTNNIGMGGVEAIKILLQIDPEIRAIVATGYSFDPVVSNFREYGFCGAITKPFGMDELIKSVKEALKD